MKPLSRRALLRGAGGIAVALPWLEAMEARGQTAVKKRFVMMFTPNGINPATWTPTGTSTAFTLSPSLTPLEPWKSKVLIFDNLKNRAALNGPGNAHARGTGLLFTGSSLSPEPLFGEAGWPQSISVDQEIANKIGGDTRFRSLELGVQVNSNTNVGRISFKGANLPIEPQNNPKAAFDRIFSGLNSGGGTPDPAAEQLRLRRKSILDSIKGDFTALNATLGAEDKQRMEAHLNSIRELERELTAVIPPAPTGCSAPVDPATSNPSVVANYMVNANFPAVGALQTKILVTALKCDLTRVASLMWARGVGNTVMSWLGITENHHALSHLIQDTQDARDKITRISNWYAAQFAELLRQMNDVVEGDRRLLDNSVIIWGNELDNGDTHSRNNIPFIVAGSGGGYFRTGRFLRFNAENHNNLMVSCMNAMGVPATTFGKPEFCTGPLSGLT